MFTQPFHGDPSSFLYPSRSLLVFTGFKGKETLYVLFQGGNLTTRVEDSRRRSHYPVQGWEGMLLCIYFFAFFFSSLCFASSKLTFFSFFLSFFLIRQSSIECYQHTLSWKDEREVQSKVVIAVTMVYTFTLQSPLSCSSMSFIPRKL